MRKGNSSYLIRRCDNIRWVENQNINFSKNMWNNAFNLWNYSYVQFQFSEVQNMTCNEQYLLSSNVEVIFIKHER